MCVAVFSAATAEAQTSLVWTGTAGNTNWNSPTNWSPNTTLTQSGTYSMTFSGTTQPATINGVGTVNITGLSFTNNGTAGQSSAFSISSGTLAFQAATITTTRAGAGALTSNNPGDTINSAMQLYGTTSITTSGSHNLSLVGNISGSGGLLFNTATAGQSSIVYISGSNDYTGGTDIRGGNVQTATQSGVPGTTVFGSGTVSVSDRGTIFVRNGSAVGNSLFLSGTGMAGEALTGSFGTNDNQAIVSGSITLNNGNVSIGTSPVATTGNSLTLSGPIDLGSNTLTFQPNRAATTLAADTPILVSGTISGAGSVTLNSASRFGNVTLNAANTYTGTTTITQGTLTTGNASALGNKAALVVGTLPGSTSILNLNNQTVTVGALSGISSGTIQNNSSSSSRLITDTTTSSTFAGVIANGSGGGNVGLTKQGSGSLTLTGVSTYTGSTSVTAGRLFVNGSLGNTPTTVQTAGVLSGTGSIGGNVTVGSGGTLSPGATFDPSYGTLSIGGNLSLLSGGLTSLGISGTAPGTFDQLATTGTTAFGGELDISIDYSAVTFGTDPAQGFLNGDKWNLFTSTAFAGNFSSVVLSGSYGNVNFVYNLDQNGNGRWEAFAPAGEFAFFTSGPNAGVLFAVPEPAAITLAGTAVGVLGMFRWRRSSRRRRDASATQAV